MASDINSEKNEDADLALTWSGRWTLAHRILAVNVLTLVLVLLAIFYLDSYRNRLEKERVQKVTDGVQGGQVWSSIFRPGSIFRKGYTDSPRNRSYVIMNSVLYHLHPVKVKRHAVKVSYTLCLGGLSFFLFILLTVTGIFLMFFYRPTAAQAWDDIAALQHDTLILHGKSDQVIPVDAAVRLATLLPRADLHLFAECGHWVQIERMASFNRMVAEFFKNGLKA